MGCGVVGLWHFSQDGGKTRHEAFCSLSLKFLHEGELLGMLFRPPTPPQSPPLDFSSMHVPQHFTGIWALGKLRRPGKSLITLELPIGYDCYRGFQDFSKEATEWHLCSLGGLVMIRSDPFGEGSSRLICFTPLRWIATSLDVEIHQDKAVGQNDNNV